MTFYGGVFISKSYVLFFSVSRRLQPGTCLRAALRVLPGAAVRAALRALPGVFKRHFPTAAQSPKHFCSGLVVERLA